MNPAKLNRLQQMGLGPVWLRRAGAATDAAVAADAHADADADAADAFLPVDAPAATSLPQAAHEPSVSPPVALPASAAHAPAVAADIGAMDWETLESAIRACTRCGLCEGRRHAVPGIGDRAARWLFVGEGPGRNEDQQGEPFVGPAGKLLDNMLRALGLARGANTYIANIVKCRPVGADGRDRPPAPDEVSACLPYLQRQVALIRPDVIVALGKTAAVSLLGLGDDTALASLRGKPREYAGIPLVITYHPAYLLRKPVDKAKTWRDLCVAKGLADGR
jgi:DNA polymerase